MTADSLAHALDARRVGAYWMARCVAHDDRNPSMSIRQDGDRVLLHCHAGCAQREIIEALKARGLWVSAESRMSANRIIAEYGYTDERGELLYQIVRFEPKDFRQRYPNG